MFLPLPLGAASNISLREANDRGEMYSTRQSLSMQTGTVTSLLHQHLRSFLLGCLFLLLSSAFSSFGFIYLFDYK